MQVISKDIDHLYMSGDEEERKSIQQTSQMFAAQITQLLFKVPRVLLLLLKTNDCLRSVDLALGEVRDKYTISYVLQCVYNIQSVYCVYRVYTECIQSVYRAYTECLLSVYRVFAKYILC